MSEQWLIRGTSFASCNCDWGCPCQFNSPSTHGHCQFASGGFIEEGYLGDIRLDGLGWAEIGYWPGEIAEGNGKLQVIIDANANDAQREALRKILHAEVGVPGSNHFSVFHSTCTEVFEPLYLPIEYECDISARTGLVRVDGVMEIKGEPIIDEFSGKPFHIGISRPAGSFEYEYAEIGNSNAKITGNIEMEMKDSFGQFNVVHYNQDGIVRTLHPS